MMCLVWTAKGVDKLLDNRREASLEKLNQFPSTLLFNEPKIVKMSIGQKHSAFISDDGSLYCSGNNEYGQCGSKPMNVTTESTFLVYSKDEKKEDIVPLRKVEFKEKVKIKDAVCGATHTLCVDTQNNIYSFGDDSSIQLFFGDSRGRSNKFHRDYAGFFKDKDYGVTSPIVYGQKERHLQYVPVKVNNLGFLDKYQQIIKDSKVKLAAGDGFTVISIQSDDERGNESVILSSGNNTLGQCGTLDTTTYVAKKVKLPDKSNCEEITCGKAHCMVLTKSNKVWAWGNNQEDQIYPMKKNIVHTPESVKVTHTGEGSQEPRVEYIKCSYNNSVIITS
nr:hypothetical protein MACL_00000768 [Theileria orientalis]